MSIEKIDLIFKIAGIFIPSIFSITLYFIKERNSTASKKEKMLTLIKYFLVTIIVIALIIICSAKFVEHYPFSTDLENTESTKQHIEQITEQGKEESTNEINVTSSPTEPNSNDYLNHNKTETSTKVEIETSTTIETVTSPLQLTFNYRISETNKKTIRLMDISGANNSLFYLIDCGNLLFSGAGTCVYPLNKEYDFLNLSMEVVLPFKENTTNTAKLIISGDGEEICTIAIDKNFQNQDLAIDVSDINTLTLRYEELGYTHISLGFNIINPILIYK